MNQPQSQVSDYWESDFAITDSDIDQIYNHFLEAEKTQTVEQIAEVIVAHRVAEERNRLKQLLAQRAIYQPKNSYEVGEELVFPSLKFAYGAVEAVREGYDPRYGRFGVIGVKIGSKTREFAAGLPGYHKLNLEDPEAYDPLTGISTDTLLAHFGPAIIDTLTAALEARSEFISLGNKWFVQDLMAEVNVGHLHLAEAVLEVNEGGPLPVEEIIVHLDMDTGLDPEVRLFSLNYGLANDDRFDEVGPPGKIAWFLRRLEPEAVRVTPERLRYQQLPYDRSVLSPQLLLLERELDDEWSDLETVPAAQHTILSLTYPHRRSGTLPLTSHTRPLFPTGNSPRQRVILRDENSNEDIVAWVVEKDRYVYGLGDWFEKNKLPVGGFITLKPGPETGIVLLDYDRRRPQREWVRLANVEGTQLLFELERRSVGSGYDDLLIVGTDFVAAVDALARRGEANKVSLSSLLATIFPSLAKLNPQETVHTKTLYSAINMLRRIPPGPLFAELIENPAFQPVGDHYWQLVSRRS